MVFEGKQIQQNGVPQQKLIAKSILANMPTRRVDEIRHVLYKLVIEMRQKGTSLQFIWKARRKLNYI